LGYDSPEELKNTIKDIGSQIYVEPQMRQECIRILQEQGKAIFEFQIRRKDGSIGWISSNIGAVRDPHGAIIRLEGVVKDIDERKRMEEEREQLIAQLQDAFAEVKKLSGLLPICCSCKKIRDAKGRWYRIEAYICAHSDAEFTHGFCPDCLKVLYPQFFKNCD
jgi:PAS domain S-box-containing protein